MKKYSIIVPIFNEEKNITNFFLEFEKFINKFLSENFELVIVNDGSTDRSKNIILEWSKRNIKLNHKIIYNQINSGYGNALKKGILNSTFENVIIIDCDQTYKFSDAEILIDKFELEEIDMIVGSRIKSIKERGKYFFSLKNIGREFIRLFACFMTKKNIKDINSGLRIFKKEKFIKVHDFLPNGFSFTSSITCLFFQHEFNVVYQDIEYLIRGGKSKIKPIKDFLNFINLIVKLTIMLKPLRVFVPLFFITFFLSLFFLILRIFFTQSFFGTGITLLIISLLFLFFGYVFEMLLIIYNRTNK
jgi:glycosyltransferase involved in cell wall biosynthesis